MSFCLMNLPIDLDVNTMRVLEEALESFAGCAVVISHDRWFLDRIAHICLRLRVTARWSGLRETTLNMRQAEKHASALP